MNLKLNELIEIRTMKKRINLFVGSKWLWNFHLNLIEHSDESFLIFFFFCLLSLNLYECVRNTSDKFAFLLDDSFVIRHKIKLLKIGKHQFIMSFGLHSFPLKILKCFMLVDFDKRCSRF